MLYGVLPQTIGGVPATTALASLCKKTTDIQSFAAANGMTVNSLYRLNDFSIYGDSGYATIQGYLTNTTGTNATLNVIGSPIFGSLTAAGSVTAKLTGVGLSVSSPPTIPLTGSSATTYADHAQHHGRARIKRVARDLQPWRIRAHDAAAIEHLRWLHRQRRQRSDPACHGAADHARQRGGDLHRGAHQQLYGKHERHDDADCHVPDQPQSHRRCLASGLRSRRR